jgi:hypothetical protein
MSWFGRQGGEKRSAKCDDYGGLTGLVQQDSPVSATHLELSPAGNATVIREHRPENDTKVVPK